jgi:hypothetical protein
LCGTRDPYKLIGPGGKPECVERLKGYGHGGGRSALGRLFV